MRSEICSVKLTVVVINVLCYIIQHPFCSKGNMITPVLLSFELILCLKSSVFFRPEFFEKLENKTIL